MNDISVYESSQLPDTLEDLTQFVLVGKAKLSAYMLKLKAVGKLGVAQAIKDQTLKDSQEIASALLAAEQRIGELLLAIPTQSGKRTDLQTSSPDGEEVKTKSEITSDMGYSRKNVDEYQQMAKNPKIVQKVIEDAIANGEVPTKSEVTKNIRFKKELDVIESSGSDAIKERVRSGEQSIRSAYLEIKEKERKKADFSARAALEEAEERHRDFKASTDKAVSINRIEQDKRDVARIAEGQMRKIENAIKPILFIRATTSGGDMSFSAVNSKNIHPDTLKRLLVDIDKSIDTLSRIKNSIQGR